MANERLRTAILRKGVTLADVAEVAQVDVKTVERWIGDDTRKPYRRNRFKLAIYLGVEELHLWPGALDERQRSEASRGEILAVHPQRWTLPHDTWTRLFESAEEQIDILVYAGFFLAEDRGLRQLLQKKAEDGVRIRLLFGDPDSPAVIERGNDEGIGTSMSAKIRNAFVLFRSLLYTENVEARLHDTVLYNSIYRADDELLVNTHLYGTSASEAPVLHLKRTAGGGMVLAYLNSLELVWSRARPLEG